VRCTANFLHDYARRAVVVTGAPEATRITRDDSYRSSC
jgi:hypothetical protein